MKVAIASRSRADCVYPIKWLTSFPFIFVEPRQFDEYQKKLGNNAIIVNILKNDQGLVYVRNFILDYFDEPILMLDDDVNEIALREGKKLTKVDDADFLPYLEKTLKEKRLGQLGVSFRPSNWLNNSELKYYDRAWACRAINVPLLKEKGLRINDEISHYGFFEDFLLALQMYKAGIFFATTYNYAFGCKGVMGENDGGQKDFRTAPLSLEEANKLQKAFGIHLVKIVMNKRHGKFEVQIKWGNMRKGV